MKTRVLLARAIFDYLSNFWLPLLLLKWALLLLLLMTDAALFAAKYSSTEAISAY